MTKPRTIVRGQTFQGIVSHKPFSQNTEYIDCTFEGVMIINGTLIEHSDNILFVNCTFVDCVFSLGWESASVGNLSHCHFLRCEFQNAKFPKPQIFDSTFTQCVIQAEFGSSPDFTYSPLKRIRSALASLRQPKEFEGTMLRNVFRECTFMRIKFRHPVAVQQQQFIDCAYLHIFPDELAYLISIENALMASTGEGLDSNTRQSLVREIRGHSQDGIAVSLFDLQEQYGNAYVAALQEHIERVARSSTRADRSHTLRDTL